MSKNIVFEGWLTKSPPSKRIWRTKWRRRWFALRQSGELPGQYFLDYFADRNCRQLKGTINLDLCEQVDAGLHMERGNGSLAQIRGSVFTIQTQTRIYHLEADCEADMEKWVDAICRVCGLRATDDRSNMLGQYKNNMTNIAAMAEHPYDTPEGTGVYIPISECVTGSRQLDKKAFPFDRANIDISNRIPLNRIGDSRSNQLYLSHPQIRLQNSDLSENESNMSDEDCTSLNASDTNIRDYAVAKSFTKLTVDSNNANDNSEVEEGPPVPPRPLKTLTMGKQHYSTYQRPSIQEPIEIRDNICTFSWVRRAGPPSPIRSQSFYARTTDEDLDHSPGHLVLQYHNLASLSQPMGRHAPPAVDRARKPRNQNQLAATHHGMMTSNQIPIYLLHQPQLHHPPSQPHRHCHGNPHQSQEDKGDALQYLDLDLPASKPVSKVTDNSRRRNVTSLGKSLTDGDSTECVYKTVDFLKTEAFNITRQDAEASRSNPH